MARSQGLSTEVQRARFFLAGEQLVLHEARCDGSNRDWIAMCENRVLAALSWVHDAQEREARNRIWKCRDGREIAIRDMGASHIMNCLTLITRSLAAYSSWRMDYMLPLLDELKRRRGD